MAARAGGAPRRIGYDQLVKNGIFAFHRGKTALTVREGLIAAFERNHLTRIARVDAALGTFDRYIEWFESEQPIVADSRVRMAFVSRGIELRGIVSRVDHLADGYRSIIIGGYPEDWQDELRMPLIQTAMALRYGRGVDDFVVGVQGLDGSGLAIRGYSARERRTAISEFNRLGARLAALAPTLPPE